MTKSKNPETIALHGGDYRSDPATTSVAVPVYRTTSYQFNDTDHAANLFALKEFGNIYTRIMIPPIEVPWPPIYLVKECITIAAP